MFSQAISQMSVKSFACYEFSQALGQAIFIFAGYVQYRLIGHIFLPDLNRSGNLCLCRLLKPTGLLKLSQQISKIFVYFAGWGRSSLVGSISTFGQWLRKDQFCNKLFQITRTMNFITYPNNDPWNNGQFGQFIKLTGNLIVNELLSQERICDWAGEGWGRVKLSSSSHHNSTPVDSEVESANVTF